ncbi:hypothetical protein [Bradyrhizobium sp. CCBAU 11357]|uniref:hypothetical protein n=1 Tax=Bradyrhizobium sp. CCBAU 11357 TaxID=1630808 RepID=UPI002302144C|nr:hypothetical protein [Bradyrhizobium sp. CCBAU 11357]MDA9501884.1 hypothetical protein [Bradyrhizobium sp. CCBAU 11357]
MSTRKTLMLASLALIAFQLPRAELFSRIAEGCNCDRSKMACRIQCSDIGSGSGTGGGSSTFRIAPDVDRPVPERPIVVPSTVPDIRSSTGQINR